MPLRMAGPYACKASMQLQYVQVAFAGGNHNAWPHVLDTATDQCAASLNHCRSVPCFTVICSFKAAACCV